MNPQRLYLFAVAIRGLGFGTAFTLFAVYLIQTIGVNPMQLALPAAAYELTQFLFEIPTGVVADVYSRRLSVIIGYGLLGIGLILAGSIPIYMMAVIGLIVCGVGATFVSGALTAWLVDEIGQEEASKSFLQRAQISLVIGLLGIALSVVLGSISLQLPVLFGGAVLIFGAIVLMIFMPETGFTGIPVSERESWKDLFGTFRESVQQIRTHQLIFLIFIVTLILGGFGEAFGLTWQAHILDVFALPTIFDDVVWFGLMSASFVPIGLISTELIRRHVDLSDNNIVIKLLRGVFTAMSASVLLFALSDNFALMIGGLWLTRTTLTMARPLLEAWINQYTASDVRATILSIQGQANSVGEVVGGPFVGLIGTLSSIRLALSLSILMLLPLIPVLRRSEVAEANVN